MYIYMLSGLGADRRAFDFLDLSGHEVYHVEWIEPHREETIEHYASRLLNQIQHVRPTLIGVSFGGMVAVELGKLLETEKIILISSAKTKYDIPRSYRILRREWFRKLLKKVHKHGNFNFISWLFSANTRAEKELLRTSLSRLNSLFFSWAIEQISTWKNQQAPKNVVVIHGTHDRIFPLRSAHQLIHGGGHLMVVSKAKEVSSIINKILPKPAGADIRVKVGRQFA